MSFWGSVGTVAEDFLLPAAHAGEGIAHMAGAHMGRAIPYVGAVIGAGQMIGHGIAAFNATNQDAAFDHLGSATLGMLGGIPAVGAYVGGAELAWNAGATAGGALAGGGIGGAHHAGALANQMVGRGLRTIGGALNGEWWNPLTPRTSHEGGGEGH